MARIRSKDTGPEIAVRKTLHRLGYRFRLHARKLPGHPDIVLRRHRAVILVHGCFWHRHAGCPDCSQPKSRQDYWEPKFAANVARDQANELRLSELGWRVLTIWACETENGDGLRHRLIAFLGPGPRAPQADAGPAAAIAGA